MWLHNYQPFGHFGQSKTKVYVAYFGKVYKQEKGLKPNYSKTPI
jgi:hypothetical protein